MSLLDELVKEECWLAFREYKSKHSLMSQKEFDALDEYIREKKYLPVAENLQFSLPKKTLINKSGSTKKRVVYLFEDDELWVLKLLTWLLYKYDYCFSDNCYSFRKNSTAKTAFTNLLKINDLSSKYVLKIDIHDYFNSMPVELLIKELSSVITDDKPLLDFLISFYSCNKAIMNGEIIEEERGAMAGNPLSSFCANIYLRQLDYYFKDNSIPYCRYSDDILVIADSLQQINEYYEIIKDHIEQKGLQLNPDKYLVAGPNEPWDFLGFRYVNGQIDLAEATIRKMKARIKRKAEALYRWKIRKNADYEKVAKVLIRKFNRKFYDFDGDNEFTWSKWFFPVLTTSKGLKEIDDYFLEYIRYLYSGRHYKGNYKVSYDDIKKMGYHSLVHEFYLYKEDTTKAD